MFYIRVFFLPPLTLPRRMTLFLFVPLLHLFSSSLSYVPFGEFPSNLHTGSASLL